MEAWRVSGVRKCGMCTGKRGEVHCGTLKCFLKGKLNYVHSALYIPWGGLQAKTQRMMALRVITLQALLVTSALLLALLAVRAVTEEEDDEEDLRLPLEVFPRRYRLDIQAQLEEDFLFRGEVWIEVEASKAAERITFHRGVNLDVDLAGASVHLLRRRDPDAVQIDDLGTAAKTSGERRILLTEGVETQGSDRVALVLGEPLLPGRRYVMHLSFYGVLSDDLTGFYRVSYKEANETKWIATTVFEPAEARRAFPCFDEPALKARFQVNVARPEACVALSNMPLKETESKDGGWKLDRFQETPPMSSYLVAWTVGPLSSRDAPGGRLRVWARPEAIRDADYALRLAPRLHQWLSQWIGQDDPMPKTDLLALPSFVSDALENWGLISFGERYLLSPPNSSAAEGRIGFILGHELAHIWFGNLVTLNWWDAIWLNEGFATYFGALALHGVDPEQQVVSTTTVRAFLEVFSVDALRSSHALTASASKSSELHQIFDTITYYKGYYVLRMLNHTLGEAAFQRGIRRYVAINRLGNAREQDLWSALSTQARHDGVPLPGGRDVGQLMEAWTRRPGYPVLTIRRQYEKRAISITQERFLRAPGDTERQKVDSSRDGSDSGWWVPLTLTWEGGPQGQDATRPYAWLDPQRSNTTLRLDLPEANTWLLANVNAVGLYRVNYDARNWAMLAAALRRDHKGISALSRALLVDDALDLARAGRLSYATALDLIRYLRGEQDLEPWLSALQDLDFLHRMLPAHTPAGDALQRFLLQLLSPRFAQLGLWPRAQEPPPVGRQRRLLAHWACVLGDARCVHAARENFTNWRNDPKRNSIRSDMRLVVLCTAVEHGTQDDWDFLWDRFQNSTSINERAAVLAALGCSRDPEVLRRLLDLSIQAESPIRKQHSAAVFESVAKNPVGHSIAQSFLLNNIDRISEYVGNNPFHLPQLLQALTYRMNTREELKQLEQLHEGHAPTLRAATRSLQQLFETVRFNIDWMERHQDVIAMWLESAPQLESSTTPSAPNSTTANTTVT